MRRVIRLENPEATRRLGDALGAAAGPGLVVALRGEVGAGKTTLCQGFIARRTGIAFAPSPTFTLLQAYPGGLYHLDLYRLEATDLTEFGLEDILAPDALLLIEWPERAGAHLPKERLEILLEPDGAGRSASLSAAGAVPEETVHRLRWSE